MIPDRELSALIDGELSPEDEEALRARIAADPALAARLAQLEEVDAQLRALPVPELPAGAADALRARVAEDAAPVLRLPVWAMAAAGVAVAAALAVYLLLPGAAPLPENPEPLASETALDAATAEEIGIALDYDTLADLEVIENLELLEWMAEQSG